MPHPRRRRLSAGFRRIEEFRGFRGFRGVRGFTLIELLVVISIVAMLVSLLLPALAGARGTARDLQCKTQLRSFATAIYMYQDDARGVYPPKYVNDNVLAKTWHGYYLKGYMDVRPQRTLNWY